MSYLQVIPADLRQYFYSKCESGFQWFLSKVPEFANCKPQASNEAVCRYIATLSRALNIERNIALFKWALANGCPWDEHVAPRLAKRNKLDVLKWCHENGCPDSKRSHHDGCHGGSH